jgi:hypothetical protein
MKTKPELELPDKYVSQDMFAAEVGRLLSARDFFRLADDTVVHLVDRKLIEVTPEYLQDYINREFQCFERI